MIVLSLKNRWNERKLAVVLGLVSILVEEISSEQRKSGESECCKQ